MQKVLWKFNYFILELTNGTIGVYYCEDSSGKTAETCYESVDNSRLSLNVSQDQKDFMIQDGGCCESKRNNSAICCIIGLNRAVALQGIVYTLGSLVLTSSVLAFRLCR